MTETRPPSDEAKDGGDDRPSDLQLTVKIFDEETLTEYSVISPASSTVGHVVAAFYREDLRRERDPEDRLWCTANGDSVFAHETEELASYARRTCRELSWTFVGPTGGA